MIIPNDKGGDWRANKFVEYANFVPPIHQSFFWEYSNRRNLSEDQCIFLAFLMGNFYSELTAIFAFEEWDMKLPTSNQVNSFFDQWNDRIVYGTARKWQRYNERSKKTLNWFVNNTENSVSSWFDTIAIGDTEREVYDNVQKSIRVCPEYGRFACDLFNEILMIFNKNERLSKKLRSDESINFYEGDNLTSGMFNIIYMDDRADEWDKTKKITKYESDLLHDKILWVKEIYENKFPDKEIDVPLFVTKICSFRNCFKGKRGGGYHHYRQLKYLREFELIAPHKESLWKECYDIRKKMYPEILLGEMHGIVGIPREICKWWLRHGWIGNEPEALASIKTNTIDSFF